MLPASGIASQQAPTQAPVIAAAPSIKPFKSSLPTYKVGPAPQVSAKPWDPLGGRGFSFGYEKVAAPSYDASVPGPYLISPESGLEGDVDYGFREWLDIIAQQLRAGEDRRLLAAAEAQAARGMLRSGHAILSEDAVRRDTELQIAQKAAEAAVEQARLTQERDIAAAQLRAQREQSNQRAMEAWAELQEQAQQYKANLELQARLANQQAALEASGQARQYAAQMAQLETQRQIANQQAKVDMERIRAGYEQFLRELEFSSWAKYEELKLNRYSAEATAAYNMGMLDLQRRSAQPSATSIDWGKVLEPIISMAMSREGVPETLTPDVLAEYARLATGTEPPSSFYSFVRGLGY